MKDSIEKILICGKGNETSLALQYAKEIFGNAWKIHYGYLESEQELVDNLSLAKKLNILTFKITDYNHLFFYTKEINPSYVLLAQFSLIVKEDLIKLVNNKIVNLHHGSLPKYRGMGPITHAILAGEKDFATTLHFVDSQVDTGNIIKQSFFSIEGKTNEEVYNLCQNADEELINFFFNRLKNNHPVESTPQNDLEATYFPRESLSYNNPEIQFNQSANQIIRFCKAYYFPSKNLFPRIKKNEKSYLSYSIAKNL